MTSLHFDRLLGHRPYLILDGALGTRLSDRGYPLHPILWSATAPDTDPRLLQDIHCEYCTAGADILTSASYQMSYDGFAECLQYSRNQTDHALVASIRIARNAAAAAVARRGGSSSSSSGLTSAGLVAASIGSFGASLADGSEFVGKYAKSMEQLREWHRRRFDILVSAKPDVIACETVPCLDEVKALLQLLSTSSNSSSITNEVPSTGSLLESTSACTTAVTRGNPDTNLDALPTTVAAADAAVGTGDICPPAWISVSCKSGTALHSGESLEDFARVVEDSGEYSAHSSGNHENSNIAIGINCTSPRFAEECLLTLKDTCRKTRILVAYPNRGDEWDMQKKDFVPGSGCSDEEFGQLASKWYKAGARVIGGCCCTTPSTIDQVTRTLPTIIVPP